MGRKQIQHIVEEQWFARLVIAIIIVNALVLGLETSKPIMAKWGDILHAFDIAFILFFVCELGLKLFAYRLQFFRGGWNIFDFVIVGLTMAPIFGNLSVLRSLRILRALRLFSMIPRFRIVVEGFFDALSGLVAVAIMLFVMVYIAAVMATKLFGETFPEIFGTLTKSLFSMFQLVTLEGWTSEIVRPVMEVYPWAWLFFIPFIGLTTFTIFNLLIGIIVNSMQRIYEKEEQELYNELHKSEETQEDILEKIHTIEKTLHDLKKALKRE